MSEYYFTFRSLTQGQLACQLLKERGIHSVLIRAPKALSQSGCGYALNMITLNPSEALRRLKDGGIPPIAVFRRNPATGQPEAIRL